VKMCASHAIMEENNQANLPTEPRRHVLGESLLIAILTLLFGVSSCQLPIDSQETQLLLHATSKHHKNDDYNSDRTCN
jgi:hypothetical protein